MESRESFRAHPLDGAMLYFHPATGTHVRVETEATRALERTAPRVLMFGITNACNLRCDFCSRDVARKSEWTLESAADMIEGFAQAGTLEVAFGGGEPFAFRDFPELLLRLGATTNLALHVTTNGTLLDDAILARLDGALSCVRVSIYDETNWRRAASALLRAKQTWGANVLVDDAIVPNLPQLLIELSRLGALDVSLLSYVGAEPSHSLSDESLEILASIVSASPVACRVSVCLGARLRVPRLFDGASDDGDCGAGVDFLSITPDRRVQSCSFQDESISIASANDALRVWRTRRELLRRASPRGGCAREGRARKRNAHPGIRIWQSWSGNNSGECVLVSKFETCEKAENFLAELIPGFISGEPYSAPWKELFAHENVEVARSDATSPEEMITVGRTFIARTDMAMGDEFAELRALTWKRGGEVIGGGIHVHGDTPALAILRARDPSDAKSIAALANASPGLAVVHGLDVIVVLTRAAFSKEIEHPRKTLAPFREALAAIAEDRIVAWELFFDTIDRDALVNAAKDLGADPKEKPRLAFRMWSPESSDEAEKLAADFEGHVTSAKNLVLLEDVVRKNRPALHAYRKGAAVTSLVSEALEVWMNVGRPAAAPTKGTKAAAVAPIDAALLEREIADVLRASLGEKSFALHECKQDWGKRATLRVHTAFPADVIRACATYADARALHATIGIREIDSLGRAIRRLKADVSAIERERGSHK